MQELLENFLSGGQITEDEHRKLNAVLTMFEKKWGIRLTAGNAGMFFTHLVIALGRIRGQAPAPVLAQSVEDEVRAAPAYFTCVEAVDDIEDCMELTFPDAERGYFYLHLNKFFEDCSY